MATPSAVSQDKRPDGAAITSVLLVDDHPIVREGMRSLLEDEPDLSIVGLAGDGSTAVHEAERLKPDVVIMDITMPGLNGIDATRAIAGKRPNVGVLMLSMHSSPLIIRRAMDAGARGYVLKESEISELVRGVRAVASGNTFLGRGLPASLLSSGEGREAQNGKELLTEPERKILKLVTEGNSNPEIASMIGLTRRTVETYRLRLMRKLNIDNLPALVRYAIRQGIIPLE